MKRTLTTGHECENSNGQAYLVGVELPVRSDIEEAAGCVV